MFISAAALTPFGDYIADKQTMLKVNTKIKEAKQSFTDTIALYGDNKEALEKLTILDDDFGKWAKDFIKEKKFVVKKELLARQEVDAATMSKRLAVSKQVFPYFESLFKDIITAFNALTKHDTSLRLKLVENELPLDLFYNPSNVIIIQIILDKQKALDFFFAGLLEYSEYPVLYIRFDERYSRTFKHTIEPEESNAIHSNLIINPDNQTFKFETEEYKSFLHDNFSSVEGSLEGFKTFSKDFSKHLLEVLLVESEIDSMNE
jgi:hypothetical protein